MSAGKGRIELYLPRILVLWWWKEEKQNLLQSFVTSPLHLFLMSFDFPQSFLKSPSLR